MIHIEQLACLKYGMHDGRLSEAISDITASFCHRTFQSMMPLIIEVLETMTKKYELEQETVCVSYGNII